MKKVFRNVFILLFTSSLLAIFLQIFYQRLTEKIDPEQDWLQRQKVRKEAMNFTCLNKNLSSSKWRLKSEVARQLFVVENYKLIYCEVPKVGCTNWKKILLLLTLNLSRDPSDINGDTIHYTHLLKRLSSYPSEKQVELMNNYTKIIFIRHPLERLVSAYRDKFYHSEPYYASIANRIKALSRGGNNSTGQVTFQEFVKFVLSEQIKYMDIHWKPMFMLCDPCNIHYNIVGKYETLEQDVKHVLRRIRAPDHLSYPDTKRISTDKRTNVNITSTYFMELSWDKLWKIKELYRVDLSLFNYIFYLTNQTLP
ncbi:carbohydrate sulfotransferase 8-like [Hemicordylus capensis]|uniref:carbohydrate sulfotransferase 8-like n=1 Tax=Hemicordylus capensis TaxID=884348 RepID=UPI0023040456|nr:carbohydrate sulfotransferase 8-like [Hemicordylus capensis]